MNQATFENHPAADLFPMMTKSELESLSDDIKRNGLLIPIVLHEKLILDGRNRLQACIHSNVKPRYSNWSGIGSPTSWVISMNAKRRHLTPSQIACLAVEALPLLEAEAKKRLREKIPGSSKSRPRETLSKELKVNDRYIQDAKKLKSKNPDLFKKVASGKTNLHQAMRHVKKEEYRQKRHVPDDLIDLNLKNVQLIHGDLKKAGKEIKDSSVDAIITDPPYPKEFLHVFKDLSELAERVLKPGGSLIIMSGQSYLPEIMKIIPRHDLQYHWTFCYLTEGAQAAQLWQKKVLTYWKPILWFVKGKFKGDWSSDVIKSTTNDKRFHKWGQSECGMMDLIEKYTLPNQTILDPFLGGGTTGVVAAKLGRKFIGIDIEESAIKISRARIAESCQK